MATAQAGVPELRLATTRLATGPQVHYSEQGEAGGQAILLLHGWPDSWFSFSRVMPLLAAKGYHVYALSQRGFGDSERPDSGYTINDFAADASAFMDAIGVSRATLAGHSMGSFVARRVVELYPERAARLVLIGSAVTAANEVLLAVREEVRSLKDPVSPDFAREFQASTAYAPLPEPFVERIVVESLKLPAHLWRAALDGVLAFDDSSDLRRIGVPTLLLWGEQDALFSRDDQERLIAAIPDARLTVYKETGHGPNWERPEQVADDLDTFIRQA